MSQVNNPSSLFDYNIQRFFFLYGKTDDEFCTAGLERLTLEGILHRHLQQLGYQRIAFYNGRQKIYFHDLTSRELARPRSQDSVGQNTTQSPQKPPTRRRKRRNVSGPLGSRRTRTRPSTVESPQNPTNNQPISTNSNTALLMNMGSMNDVDVVRTFSRWMIETDYKTALIFPMGMDLILHFSAEARRDMGISLTEWKSLLVDNENICLFIFPDMDGERLHRLLENSRDWEFLYSSMFSKQQPTPAMINIHSPHEDEVRHLIHYHRLQRGLSVDWKILEQAITPITRHLRSSDGRGKVNSHLKHLSRQLLNCSSLDAKQLETLAGQFQQQSALQRLKNLRGLETVISKVEPLVNEHQERQEKTTNKSSSLTLSRLQPPRPAINSGMNLHFALTGSPGTGKTLSARLIAEIYAEEGLLELGHFIKVTSADLVAGYVGQTAIQTSQYIRDAMGGVLFIDEAYTLSDSNNQSVESQNSFGQQAIDTLVEAMTDHMGQFSVIIAGYPQKIREFIASNDGLRSRFSEEHIIEISDYPWELLRDLFQQEMDRAERILSPDVQTLWNDFFQNWYDARDPESFGNVRDVKALFASMNNRRASRVRQQAEADPQMLIKEDIPVNSQRFLKKRRAPTVDSVLESLDELVGLHGVKDWLRGLTYKVQGQQKRQQRGLPIKDIVPGHYFFAGNPGTGKTTVAQRLGEILNLLGLLGHNEVIAVQPDDLKSRYVSGTGTKSLDVYKKALNHVLFIDEAHQLADGSEQDHGREAVHTLVPFMENNRQHICIILAGYPDDLQRLYQLDQGLKSRISEVISFDDFSAEELLEIFQRRIAPMGDVATTELEQALLQHFEQWIAQKKRGFGNAREVRNLIEVLETQRDQRLHALPEEMLTNEVLQTFEREDLPD